MSKRKPPVDNEETILEHLNQLRIRLTWALVSVAVGAVVSFTFAKALLRFLIAPYSGRLQTLSPTEGIETYFKVALVSGAILAMPLVLYHLWKFIEPALEPQEKRYIYVFVPSATLLFLLGIAFAWLVLLPAAILFLSDFLPTIFAPEWTGREYLSFTTTFLFWIGVSFEMPLIIFFLARVGLVSTTTLRQQWRVAVVVLAILAAAVTPSIDPVTMLLTMTPLLILYAFSILLARVGQRRFERD